MSSDITKITQAYTTAQVNNGKLIQNGISQALTKPHDSASPNPTLDSRSSWTSNSSYKANWTLSWAPTNDNMQQQSNNDMYHLQRPCEIHISTCLCNPAVPKPNLFWLQSIHSWETELTHSTQQLHQQTKHTLNNIAKLSSFQENQHFISDKHIFKAKDPQNLLMSG